MSATPGENYQLSFALCLFFIFLIPCAIAGLALINTGLGRSRSAAYTMTSSLCVVSAAALIYFVSGAAIQGSGGIGTSSVELQNQAPGLFLRHVRWDFSSMMVLWGCLGVGLASLIPLGASGDRWRLSPACISSVLLAGWTVPLYARLAIGMHTWGHINDAAGSGFINGTGGLSALSIVWLLGPRRGKYSANGMPAAIPAHNAVLVLFGCMLAWIGWMGLNSAGAMLYTATPPERSVLVALNTTFSAAAAALTAATVTRIRFRRPDASLIANGWMAGLVASSAGCAAFKPATATLTGLIAGALVVFSVEFFEFSLKVDDPCGSISVHGAGGIWGLLAVGIFAGGPGQLKDQIVGAATLLGFVFPMSYGLNWLLNRFLPYRVSLDGERQGLDLHELGADAYPEFVVHADEFMQR